MWSDGLSYSGLDFNVGGVVFVRDAKELAEASHLLCLDPSLGVQVSQHQKQNIHHTHLEKK